MSSLREWKLSLPTAGGWNRTSFKDPPNPNHSMVLRISAFRLFP